MKALTQKATILMFGLLLNVVGVGALTPHSASAQRACQTYRVARPHGLYVYVNAGSRIVTTLPYNQIVRVDGLSNDGSWAKIRYRRVDGQVGAGWVATNYLGCYQK
ncbi:SH3 domain-containing protein [Pseudanabaenaceae cyanobacterium LEGE 13415]|nr:SH3 domain-containing protein [Pseudanabaenaceae cyanobacterium LEGE 13415]